MRALLKAMRFVETFFSIVVADTDGVYSEFTTLGATRDECEREWMDSMNERNGRSTDV